MFFNKWVFLPFFEINRIFIFSGVFLEKRVFFYRILWKYRILIRYKLFEDNFNFLISVTYTRYHYSTITIKENQILHRMVKKWVRSDLLNLRTNVFKIPILSANSAPWWSAGAPTSAVNIFLLCSVRQWTRWWKQNRSRISCSQTLWIWVRARFG